MARYVNQPSAVQCSSSALVFSLEGSRSPSRPVLSAAINLLFIDGSSKSNYQRKPGAATVVTNTEEPGRCGVDTEKTTSPHHRQPVS